MTIIENTEVKFIEHFDHDKEINIGEKGIVLDIKNSPLGYEYLVKFNNLEQWCYEFQIQKT